MILELDADNMAFDVVVPPALATHKDKQTVLTLYDLSGQCADVVASWLLGQGRSKDSEQVQYDAALRQRATAGVEWLFIKSPVEALGSWLDGAPNHSFSLGRYVVEYRLFHWIVDQNCAKGVAPQYKQLRDHAANIVPEALPAPEKAKLVSFFLANTRASRYWLVSSRQRWGVKPGALVAGQALEPEDLHLGKLCPILFVCFAFEASAILDDTVWCLEAISVPEWGPVLSPKWGPVFGSKMGASFGSKIGAIFWPPI